MQQQRRMYGWSDGWTDADGVVIISPCILLLDAALAFTVVRSTAAQSIKAQNHLLIVHESHSQSDSGPL